MEHPYERRMRELERQANHHKGRADRAERQLKSKDDVEPYLFFNTVSFGNVAVSVTVTAPTILQLDADFEWMKSTYYAELHGFTAPLSDASIPQLTLQIVQTGDGRQLFSAATPLSMIAGTGREPFVVPQLQRFKGGSTLSFSVTNLSSANVYDNVFFCMIGRKLYQYGKGHAQ